MGKSVRFVSVLVLALGLGFAAAGRAQNPPCDGCFTTPLAASGNGSCFVNMCFTYDPLSQKVTITSFQQITGCSALTIDQLLEALEKEAIRIAIERCTGCNPKGTRIFTADRALCFRPGTGGGLVPCSGICRSSYEVTCDPLDPYTWIWGTAWGTAIGNCGMNTSCTRYCPW